MFTSSVTIEHGDFPGRLTREGEDIFKAVQSVNSVPDIEENEDN